VRKGATGLEPATSRVTAPIVGATKIAHLEDALAAAELTLSADEIARLEESYRPHPCSATATATTSVARRVRRSSGRGICAG
jgi:diketogulonate reductase-like aldo/keto reductase